MSLLMLDLAGASQLIQSRQISSEELTQTMLEEAHRVNPTLNAFLRIDDDVALQKARAADEHLRRGLPCGPLHGVPLAHKDMFNRAGIPTSCGSKVALPIPTRTAAVLESLDAAGAIAFGVLNMSSFAVGPTGHNESFGSCRNPWSVDRAPGGSSSGSASSVAAHANFAALGSDTGGSIRIPASLCGLTGLRSSPGLVSRAGVMGLSSTLDVVGPLARNAQDCRLMMQALSPRHFGPGQAGQFKTAVGDRPSAAPLDGIRIGVPRNYFNESVDDEVLALAEQSLDVLRRLGCEVKPIDIPDLRTADTLAGVITAVEGAALHQKLMQDQADGYGAHVRIRIERGFAIPAPAYVNALRYRPLALQTFLNTVFTEVDVLHTPVLPIRAPRLDSHAGTTSEESEQVLSQLTRFTRPVSYLGLPSLALPMGFTSDKMPSGMQLIGRPSADIDLLAVAAAYQVVTDWHTRIPRV